MAIPKYTAQLAAELRLKKQQAILACTVIVGGPIITVFFLFGSDKALMDGFFIPIFNYFWGWVCLAYIIATIIKCASLSWRIKNVEDTPIEK